MSQTPNDPRNSDLGSANQEPLVGQQPPAPGEIAEPTRSYQQVEPAADSSDQPTDVYPRSDAGTSQSPTNTVYNQTPGNSFGAHSAAGQPSQSEYAQSEAPLNYPVPPERAAKKKFAGSTLITGMVIAALIGGASASATTYLLADNSNSAGSSVQTPQSGIVINNTDSVNEVTAAAAKASPSVVTIEASGGGVSGSGSGITLDTDGHILTNTHVVTLGGETADPTLTVRLNDGKVYSATLTGTDPLSDLAIIKIDAKNLVPATLGKSSELNVGDTAVAIGAPLGLSGTVTDGIISTLNRTISVASSAVPEQSTESQENGGGSQFNFQFPGQEEQQQQSSSAGSIYINVIQTDAAINHGNSGGALVNAKGEIIGVNVAIASSGSGSSSSEDSGSIGVGFAIPIDHAQRVAQEIIANGKATHGLLGATVQPQGASTGNTTSQFSVGAAIVEVTKGSAAEKAGLKSGDIITGVSGRPIQDSQTLTAAIREVPAGGNAEVTYTRNGVEKTVTVTVGTL